VIWDHLRSLYNDADVDDFDAANVKGGGGGGGGEGAAAAA
jgi:hypothetical protein